MLTVDMRAAGGWGPVPGVVGRTDRPPGVAEREPGVPGWVRPAARARCREATCVPPLAARLDPIEPNSAGAEVGGLRCGFSLSVHEQICESWQGE